MIPLRLYPSYASPYTGSKLTEALLAVGRMAPGSPIPTPSWFNHLSSKRNSFLPYQGSNPRKGT